MLKQVQHDKGKISKQHYNVTLNLFQGLTNSRISLHPDLLIRQNFKGAAAPGQSFILNSIKSLFI